MFEKFYKTIFGAGEYGKCPLPPGSAKESFWTCLVAFGASLLFGLDYIAILAAVAIFYFAYEIVVEAVFKG